MGDFFVADNGWRIVLHAAEEGGYWGEVPAMPGCVSEGETEEECRANVIEAAEGCMEAYISMAISRLSPMSRKREMAYA